MNFKVASPGSARFDLTPNAVVTTDGGKGSSGSPTIHSQSPVRSAARSNPTTPRQWIRFTGKGGSVELRQGVKGAKKELSLNVDPLTTREEVSRLIEFLEDCVEKWNQRI